MLGVKAVLTCWVRRLSLCAGCAGSPHVLGAHGQNNSQGAESYSPLWGMFRLSERNGKLVSLLPSERNFAESNWAGGEAFACVPTFRVRCFGCGTPTGGQGGFPPWCAAPLTVGQVGFHPAVMPRAAACAAAFPPASHLPCFRRHVLRIVPDLYVLLTSRSAFQKHLYLLYKVLYCIQSLKGITMKQLMPFKK